jgi:hypothetical protein
VQDEGEPLGRCERLEHDVEGEADTVGDECFLLRGRRAVDRDDRLGHPRADELFAARPPRAEHVEAHAAHHRRQPGAEVLDRGVVAAAEPDPCLLHGVVGFVERAQHAVGDAAQLGALRLELRCEEVVIVHLTLTTYGHPEM